MIVKDRPLRSTALRKSARDAECTLRLPGHCSGDPSTSVLAHLPFGGRGIGRKASDEHAVIACAGCHDALDRRVPLRVSELELMESVIRAHAETQSRWRSIGLVTYKER